MRKVTYGVPRLIDWVAELKVGAAKIKVHFTGGALTAYGVTPAEYTTENAFIQKVIETSSDFKSGRILKVREVGEPDPVKPKPAKAKVKPAPAPEPEPAEPEVDEVEVDEVEETAPEEETEETEEVTEAEETENDGLTVVEVTCLQDAQAYLQENYQLSTYKIRTYELAQQAAAEHGVKFVGSKFGTASAEAE